MFYKLAKSTFAAALTGLLFSMLMLRFATFWLACYVAMFLALVSLADTRSVAAQARELTVDAMRAERRVALVIGNGAYTHVRALPNPTNDAQRTTPIKIEVKGGKTGEFTLNAK